MYIYVREFSVYDAVKEPASNRNVPTSKKSIESNTGFAEFKRDSYHLIIHSLRERIFSETRGVKIHRMCQQ